MFVSSTLLLQSSSLFSDYFVLCCVF